MRKFELRETKLLLFIASVICLLGFAQLAAASAVPGQDISHAQPKQEAKSLDRETKPTTPPSSSEGPGRPSVTIAPQISVDNGKTSVETKTDSKPQSLLRTLGRGLLEVLKIAVSWPFIVGALLFYLIFFRTAPHRLATILKPFRSLKLFGTEFVLSEEAGSDAEEAIANYRKQVKRRFDSLIETHDIRAKLEAVIDDVEPIISGRTAKIKDLRYTLHVSDILFADSLYQLLDYYPRGGGSGRVWSSRFGIIGLCWRLRADQIEGEVPTDKDKLIRGWGMNEEEANASGSGRQSFLALILRDHSATPVAIFYMDAGEQNVFGAHHDKDFREQLKAAVISASNAKGLIPSLEKLRDDLKDRKPLIHIHAQ